MWIFLPQMKFKKRLLFLSFVVIFGVLYLYFNSNWNAPVSNGWNQNTSKDVRNYVSESSPPHIIPKDFCQKSGILLVMVNIKPDDFEVRHVIRETWARKRANVSFYFLVGEERNHNYEVQVRLKFESEKYNDIIQERFLDSYNNLTLKSINMLKLFSRHCSKSYKYLMKIDGDVFLNVHNVLEMLSKRNSETDFLVGKLINDTKPFRDPRSKWYVPRELFPEEKYPDYLCGPTYLMSSDVAENLYRCTFETPIFYIEDVYITGICAKKINVVPRHDSMFKCQYTNKYICLHREKYSIHYYKPEEIRKAYRILVGNGCPASGSIMEWVCSLLFSVSSAWST
ncbi:beta-1,3-galactosyltransferase 1-like isoform X2 [Zophobas morio]|uniref:beta-1,3-galactosyltransferase 1-like isoform X2 n=1 Tax=Zophobas morio TaxID=2755281 RepID=UPI00308352B9